MLQGQTMSDMATEVQLQLAIKKDYITDTRHLQMGPDGQLNLSLDGGVLPMPVGNHAHAQIADRLSIPKKYYDVMLAEQPALLANNVNTWLHEKPETRLVRTLGGTARAFLSNSFRRLDNWDFLDAVLPVIADKPHEIVSCKVTEDRLYLKVIFPELERDITESTRINDIVRGGLEISNSEVGSGSIMVRPLLYYLWCLNGESRSAVMKKYHVGKKNSSERAVELLLTDETEPLEDTAVWSAVQDVIKSSIDEDLFNKEVQKSVNATKDEITADPAKVVEHFRKDMGFSDTVGGTILQNLIKGADLSRYGLANAFTASANTQESYATATHLERAGGKIIELPKASWNEFGKVTS